MPDQLLSIDEARAAILRTITGRLGEEQVGIDDAVDRVLAADVRAAGDVPPFACSAMDGYAVRAPAEPRRLSVSGEARAGHPYPGSLEDGEAIRISTGAPIPSGASAVVRQEDVDAGSDSTIGVRIAVAEGDNLRGAGDDMGAGELVLPAGTRLGARAIGVAVAAGAGRLTVARRPLVALASTGDELREPGEPLGPGEIHNSNGPMLRSLVHHCGALAGPVRRLPDDLLETEHALGEALEAADVVIVSGGVSVGPHDHVKPALAQLGVQQGFWGVALQPGKPTWFGTRGNRLVFGLPGNPVSTVVTFGLFVRPALESLLGATPSQELLGEAKLGHAVARNPSRDQAIRVRLEPEPAGGLRAFPTGAQGSHLLTSLVLADALALIPRGEGSLEAGSHVKLIPVPD